MLRSVTTRRIPASRTKRFSMDAFFLEEECGWWFFKIAAGLDCSREKDDGKDSQCVEDIRNENEHFCFCLGEAEEKNAKLVWEW